MPIKPNSLEGVFQPKEPYITDYRVTPDTKEGTWNLQKWDATTKTYNTIDTGLKTIPEALQRVLTLTEKE